MTIFENIVDELDTNGFEVTLDWMAAKYNEMNKLLFGERLPKCNFEIYTTGKGSRGKSLGHFYFKNKDTRRDNYSRRIYVYDFLSGTKKYLDIDSIYDYAKPTIGLNGNMSRTEKSALSTLVHEMCHYYTYRNGYAPKQGHGPEFQNIARVVSERGSNIIFPIQTYCSAEERKEAEWSEEIQAQKDKRKTNSIARRKLLIIYKESGQVRLINANSDKLVNEIVDCEKKAIKDPCKKIIVSSNEQLKEKLHKLGYKSNMISYRFWHLENDPIALDYVKKCNDCTILFQSNNADDDEVITPEIYPIQQKDPNLIKNFSFKMTNGKGFSAQNITVDQLRARLHAEFPNWSDEAIEKIINNQAYAVRESLESKFKNYITERFTNFIDEAKKKDKKVYNDKGEEVPETCECGGKIGLYIKGEPVYLCSKCKKYYGTMPFDSKKLNEGTTGIRIPSLLYHKSNPANRKSIQLHGLIPQVGDSYKAHWDDREGLAQLVFLYDVKKIRDGEYDTTYDDDIYRIDMSKLDEKYVAKDPDSWMKGCFTYSAPIPPDAITLIYKGTGKSF